MVLSRPAWLFTALFIWSAFGQEQSNSKLSAHLINSYTAGAAAIVSGKPRVLKILDTSGPMMQAARAFKAANPNGKLVARIYTTQKYAITDNAAASGQDFFNKVLSPALKNLSVSDRALIDYLEGPNEGDSTPAWQSVESAKWLNDFWVALVPLIANAGPRPCIGSIPVGNPGGTGTEVQQKIATFVPALRAAKAAGGAWSYHAYTLNYSTDEGLERSYSLRYRQFYEQFAQQFSDLSDLPLILTEGGVDQSGTPGSSGWQARGTADDYKRWLNWFDAQLQRDSYVLGCTLFEIGNPTGWSSFDLEPIASWLGTYLKAPSAPPPPATNLKATGAAGQIVLTWSSPITAPTSYVAQRATQAGGPYTTVGTNITTGVTATSWTNKPVSAGTKYYYIIKAVNAAGSSPNSNEASAAATAGLPDVIVTSVTWTPASIRAGNNVLFKATVKNQGTASTPSGTTLGVGFNVDGGGTTSWSTGYSTALAPGASVTLTADGGPSGKNSWVAKVGKHKVVATVDDINRFPELDESNNGLSADFTVYRDAAFVRETESTGKITLTFKATEGVPYQLQYKPGLETGDWLNLTSLVTPSQVTNTFQDPLIVPGQRFYRIVQQ